MLSPLISGKGEGIWDHLIWKGNYVANNDNADIACDSYHKYEEDVRLLTQLGVNLISFYVDTRLDVQIRLKLEHYTFID